MSSTARVLPFCPTELNETQFGNWNANNKTQYIGPLTLAQVVRLYWDNKGFDIGITTAGSKMFDAIAWKWSGSNWVSWSPDPAPAPTTFSFPSGGDLRVEATAVTQEKLVCPFTKSYGPASGVLPDTADGRFVWEFTGNVGFFFDGFLQGTGIVTAIQLVRRTSTDEYYVPFRLFTGVNIDPLQIFTEGPGSSVPPPPDHYGAPSPGFNNYDFTWNSANISYGTASRPQLTWDILGVTGTHLWNSSGQTTLAFMDVHLQIDEADSTKFF